MSNTFKDTRKHSLAAGKATVTGFSRYVARADRRTGERIVPMRVKQYKQERSALDMDPGDRMGAFRND